MKLHKYLKNIVEIDLTCRLHEYYHASTIKARKSGIVPRGKKLKSLYHLDYYQPHACLHFIDNLISFRVVYCLLSLEIPQSMATILSHQTVTYRLE